MLRIKNVGLTKKQNSILHEISLECIPGTITVFIGKSGAGKTSLLKCVGQLDTSYSGIIEFKDQNIKNIPLKEKADLIGYVFQQYNLFPHMTILENCTNPLRIVKKHSIKQAESIALTQLERFGLKKLAHAYPMNLSGGQQQRAAIVRALCFEPKIMCLDEPSAALDPENSMLLISILKELGKAETTIMLSTQDMPFAKAIADFIVMLEDGKIVEINRIEEAKQPHSKIGNFIDFMNT